MYPALIESYERPTTIAEALEAMANAGAGAVYLAGGTGVMPAVSARAVRPRAVIDLAGVEELDGLSKGPRGVTIRPMTRLRNLARSSALDGAHQAITDAAATIGDRQVRNAGTVGGGLFWQGDAACMATVALCLDAVLELRAPDGAARLVPAAEFLERRRGEEGDGRALLAEVRLPRPAPMQKVASAYKKAPSSAGGPPLAGVAASIEVDPDGRCIDARIAVGGMAPSPRLSEHAAAMLRGTAIGESEADAAAAAAAADALAPLRDDRAASYRKALVRSLGRIVISRACLRARDRLHRDPPP